MRITSVGPLTNLLSLNIHFCIKTCKHVCIVFYNLFSYASYETWGFARSLKTDKSQCSSTICTTVVPVHGIIQQWSWLQKLMQITQFCVLPTHNNLHATNNGQKWMSEVKAKARTDNKFCSCLHSTTPTQKVSKIEHMTHQKLPYPDADPRQPSRSNEGKWPEGKLTVTEYAAVCSMCS